MTDRDNEGAIWGNERKETDRHPDFTGQATVDGVEYWVSAWKRGPDAKPKSPALKFSFKRKDDRRPEPNPAQKADEFDDTIPF